MFKLIALTFALVLALACGGSGLGGGGNTGNPFAGTWVGPFTIPAAGENGTANITVSSTTGSVTGTGHNNTQNFDFQVVGTLDNGGNIQGTISGGTAGTLSGTLAIAQDGHLKGTVIQTQGQNTISLNFDLVKQ